MTRWRTRIACCITKAADTHSEYVILIPFPLQQWLYERAWMLRYTYVACIVSFKMFVWTPIFPTPMDSAAWSDRILHAPSPSMMMTMLGSVCHRRKRFGEPREVTISNKHAAFFQQSNWWRNATARFIPRPIFFLFPPKDEKNASLCSGVMLMIYDVSLQYLRYIRLSLSLNSREPSLLQLSL